MPGGAALNHRQPARLALRALWFALLFGSGCGKHVTLDGDSTAQRCASCHFAQYQSVTEPQHPGVRPTTCGVCHLQTSWHPYRLNHAWPLAGAHEKAACFACHRGEPRQFAGTAKECLACHGSDQAEANLRVTHHAQFSTTCQTCHSTVAWKPTLAHDGALGGSGVPEPEASTGSAEAVTRTPAAKREQPAPASSARKVPASGTSPSAAPTRAPRRKPDSVTGASPVWNK
jgi:hypothetical protein